MKLVIEFSETEEFALKQFAARYIANADDRAVSYAIRKLIRDRLIAEEFLNRDEIESETVLSTAHIVQGIVRPNQGNQDLVKPEPKPEPATANGKLKHTPGPRKNSPVKVNGSVDLHEPQRIFAGKVSFTYQTWETIVDLVAGEEEPTAIILAPAQVVDATGMGGKQADAAMRSLEDRGWLSHSGEAGRWTLTERAAAWIALNRYRLVEDGVIRRD